jgi:hypothetical protein
VESDEGPDYELKGYAREKEKGMGKREQEGELYDSEKVSNERQR